MSLLPHFSDLLADNPVHRAVIGMQKGIATARGDINTLACALKPDGTICRNILVSSPPKSEIKVAQSGLQTFTQPKVVQPVQPGPVAVLSSIEVPTEEETTIELKKRLNKEIAKAENDLTNKLKIPRKDGTLAPCQCLSNKHNVIIESLAEELMPKEPNNQLYSDIINWFKVHEPQMTVQASASGKYDEDYIKFAGDLGNFRRKLSRVPGSPSSETVKSIKDFLKDKAVTNG